ERATAFMRTRDGVRLDADIWRPEGEGPFPVLLMRQPYGRSIASTVVYAHPRWYARHGYIVVIQDVRGRGSSEGTFRIFEQELADGHDTLDWAADLPGSSGAVGMYGFSYQGISQLMATSGGHEALRTICPAMYGYDIFADVAYEGGSFKLHSGMSWAIQLSVEGARRAGDQVAHQALFAASRALPLTETWPLMPTVLERHGHYGHYRDWITRPQPGPFWDQLSPRHHAGAVKLPALHIGGWYDGFLTGTLGGYRDFAARDGAGPQHLVVGPWVHIPWAERVGARDFGPDAANLIDPLQLRWFDHWLKGIDTGLLDGPAVGLFEMGGEGWRGFHGWPDPEPEAFHLTSSGRASLDLADGTMAPEPARPGEDVIVYDPWRPTPSAGGHIAYPPGPVDRRAVDARSDVLTYTTPPLSDDLHLAGDVAAELHVAADQPSFDVSAVLSEVRADGRVLNLTEGYARVGAAAAPLKLAMRATCARIAAGSALRLSVAAGSFPAHPVNAGDGLPPVESRLIDQRLITVILSHGGSTPSRLLLPVVSPP
ncbi:MAG: CocE/NonD family hydrolase, partial [Candidatus Eiseniibacteriota bacterium]